VHHVRLLPLFILAVSEKFWTAIEKKSRLQAKCGRGESNPNSCIKSVVKWIATIECSGAPCTTSASYPFLLLL
jgi:hypothetical protein